MTCKTCGPNQTPYYEEVKENVVQNHETVLSKTVHAIGVRVLDPWNIPGENLSVSVAVEDVVVVPVGTYFFNPHYGYFLVSQWNPKSRQVSLTHEGIVGTAATGTFVPAKTPFIVAPKPCCSDNESTFFPFLDADFVAPFINNTATIEVTSTFGLRVGEYVRIGTAVYRLDEIKSTREIRIFNQGAGFPAGSTVVARDSSGARQYLLVAEAGYVCTVGVTTTTGKMMVCDGTNQKVITGAAVGQVPVLTDPVTGTVQFQNPGTSSIADGSVTLAKLATGSVNSAKIVDGSIATVDLADGSVTTPKLADNSVSGSKIIAGQVTTTHYADGSINAAKIANGNILTAHIVDGQITTPKIADFNVTDTKIANGAIHTIHLTDGIVTAAKIADGNVIASKIAAGNVVTGHLANNAVTETKIATPGIINENIFDHTINGYDKINFNTLRGANILDAAVASAKMAGVHPRLGGGAAIPLIDSTNILINDVNSQEYWIWGPWVFVRWQFGMAFDTSGPRTTVDFGPLPVAGYLGEGDQVWIGITSINRSASGEKTIDSQVFPVVGSANLVRIQIYPGPLPGPGYQTLYGMAWLIYPHRLRDTAAEG